MTDVESWGRPAPEEIQAAAQESERRRDLAAVWKNQLPFWVGEYGNVLIGGQWQGAHMTSVTFNHEDGIEGFTFRLKRQQIFVPFAAAVLMQVIDE